MTNEQLENDARLRGLLAMSTLPPRRGADGKDRRIALEVEIGPDEWMAIEGAGTIAHATIVVWFGSNGSRKSREFPIDHCPRWRTPRTIPGAHLVESRV